MLTRYSTWLVILLVLGTAFVVNYQLLDYALLPRFIFVATACLLVSILLLVDSRKNQDRCMVQMTPVTVLMIAWVGFTALSGRVAELWGEYAFELARVSIYFIAFLLLRALINRGFNQELFVIGAIVATLTICGVATYQFFNNDMSISRLGMRPVTGLMSNKNLLSEYLGLLLPFAAFGSWRLRSVWRWFALLAVVWSLFLVMAILARSVWVGLVGASALVLLVSLNQRKSKLKTSTWKPAIIAVVGAVAVFLLVNEISGGVLIDRLLSIASTDSGTAGFRLKVWELTGTMIQDSPLTGVGAGNWKIAFQQFGLSKGLQYAVEPLNDYTGMAAEIGVIGSISYAGVILLSLLALVRMSLKKDEGSDFDLALLASLVVFSTTSFFSFPLHRIEHATVFVFVMAYADTYSARNILKVPLGVVVMVIIPALIGAVYIGWSRYSSELYARKALEARAGQRWAAVVKNVDKVNAELYPIEPSSTPITWYRGIASFQLGNVNAAFEDFKVAYDVNPYHVHVLNNLATCHHLKGGNEAAVELYLKAIRLNDRFPDAVKNLVAVYFNMGMYDEAICIIDESPLTEDGPFRTESELKALRFEVQKHKKKLRKEAKLLRKLRNKNLFEEKMKKKRQKENLIPPQITSRI